MSKKNRKGKKYQAPVVTKIFWEELLLAKREAGQEILQQQALIVELNKVHEKEVSVDTELQETIAGLQKTLQFLAVDVNTISLSHSTETEVISIAGEDVTIGKEFKKGLIPDGEDQLDYINIASQYLSINDKVAHLAGTAYLDVFTRLKVSTMELNQVIEDGKEDIAKIDKGGK